VAELEATTHGGPLCGGGRFQLPKSTTLYVSGYVFVCGADTGSIVSDTGSMFAVPVSW
jgi:hypothetical protein